MHWDYICTSNTRDVTNTVRRRASSLVAHSYANQLIKRDNESQETQEKSIKMHASDISWIYIHITFVNYCLV